MKEGKEDGVDWKWTNCLTLTMSNDEKHSVDIPAHEVHSKSVNGLHGNNFYGSFTIVSKKGEIYNHGKSINASPTLAQHTEPQYFEWLDEQLDDVPLGKIAGAQAFVIEINQTNTPCSKATCRKKILSCVKDGKVVDRDFPMVIARMSAYQIYETQYPKVCPTSFEIEEGRKEQLKTFPLASMCLHRWPEKE